jgi:hypothetical protein
VLHIYIYIYIYIYDINNLRVNVSKTLIVQIAVLRDTISY